MKKIFVFFISVMLISCAKKEAAKKFTVQENSSVAPYDTIAIDSFSTGAISVNIARKIKMSSQIYQDSLKNARKKLDAEKLLLKETDEKNKADKKAEDEKKKADALKLKKEKSKEIESPATQNIPKP